MQKQSQEFEQKLKLIPGLAMSLGIIKAVHKQDEKQQLIHMPLAFYPYELQTTTYNRLVEAHIIWQKLIIKVAHDQQYLTRFLSKIVKNDEFMSNIGQIYHKHKQNIKNTYKIACSRVDYMGDNDPELVQINLMSIGLLGMSDRIQKLNKIINIHNKNQQIEYIYPENSNATVFCQTIKQCLDLCQYKNGYVLMVVQLKQFNFGDQNVFKLQMLKQGRIVIVATMQELVNQLKIQQNKQAYFREKRIDCFYFRTAYAPKHFIDNKYWQIREKIQDSISVKIPSIQLLILNTKTMQAQFKKRQVLQKYLTEKQCIQIESLAQQIYQLGDHDRQFLLQLIEKSKSSEYVLKPNREGGGNNYFGERATKKMLEILDSQQKNGYILMNKIPSQIQTNIFIANFASKEIKQSTAQFSTLGSFIYKEGNIVKNQYSGTLVRLKMAEKQQGGIAIDQATIAGLIIKKK